MANISIKRKLLTDIKEHLSRKEITLIVGPRQAGKTTLIMGVKEYLDRRGDKTLFLSLDFEKDSGFFASQSALIRKIKLEFGEERGFVFIDEIQRKENAGLFLKGLYDLNLPYKFIVSGSGSLELKENIHESLIGRKRVFELNTISFDEFIDYKTGYKYGNRLVDLFDVERNETIELLKEYLNFGGYPRQIVETEIYEKARIVDEIYRSLLEKDVAHLLKVEKTEAFSLMVKILAGQIGGMINYTELSSTIGVTVPTIKKYLWYAQKIFILRNASPFYRNIRKEITKSQTAYFYDVGLRNYSIGRFGNLTLPFDFGFPFQNLVFNILKKKLRFTSAEIYFWRSKDKAEVDFVIDFGNEVVPVEVKFKDFKEPKLERSFRNFVSVYQPRKACVINLNYSGVIKLGKTDVYFMPYYKLMFDGVDSLGLV